MTPEQRERLDESRRAIDTLDDALLGLLAERARLVEALWHWKRAAGLAQSDPHREQVLMARLLASAAAQGLDPERVRPILERIVGQTLR